jgi:hypothetical protein
VAPPKIHANKKPPQDGRLPLLIFYIHFINSGKFNDMDPEIFWPGIGGPVPL